MKNKNNKLKPFNSVIQICPNCQKIDVYENDEHDCEYLQISREQKEYNDDLIYN